MNLRTSDSVVALKQYWSKVLPTLPIPPDSQFLLWLTLHDHNAETVRHGLRQTARKNIAGGFTMSQEHAIKFASRCMNVRDKQNRDLLALLENRSVSL